MAGSLEGRFRARIATTDADIRAAQALRFRSFRAHDTTAPREGSDADAFDARATHVLVEETATGRLACCFRLLRFADGSEIGGSYSAQFYGLSGLARHPGPMLELGRFCIAEGEGDPAVLRVAWGALAALVQREGIEFLFGCSSFRGTEAEAYTDAFALLKDRHLAPRRWLPRVKAPAVFRFARRLRLRKPDLKAAMRAMPPLLRSYLAMGGWVSDHAVVDRDLGTLHVFTGLEIRAVPPARLRALRMVG
jgi:L-ornithine Nalpha-acyltransferase